MRASVNASTVFLVTMFAGCTSHQLPGTAEVTIDLRWESERCKAHVKPESVTVTEKQPRVTWTITDNCNQTGDEEKETQLVFRYERNTRRKWLDPENAVARTTRGRQGKLMYKAEARGQEIGASAEYVIFYDGYPIADPKVVWGH